MQTTRSPRGVPAGNGAGGRTPHSKHQLQMSNSKFVSWHDVSVHLMWHSSGRCTIMTAFERPDDYSYLVCTPHTATEKDQDTFRSKIKPITQEMEVAPKWKKRIFDAYGQDDTGKAVSAVLADLKNRDVGEVMSRG